MEWRLSYIPEYAEIHKSRDFLSFLGLIQAVFCSVNLNENFYSFVV